MKKLFLFSIMSLFCFGNLKANILELKSPNGEIKVSFNLSDKIYYNITCNDETILKDCYLQLNLKNESLGKNPTLSNKKQSQVNEEIKPIVPFKFSKIKNQYNDLLLNFKSGYSVEFRAFDEGVAYRFITNRKGDMEVLGEDFVINFPNNYLAHLQQPSQFRTSYEDPYSHVQTNEWKSADKMSTLPVLVDTKDKYKILISEADLSDYPCMFLKGTGNNGMQSVFPKVPLEFGKEGDRSVSIVKEADYIAETDGKRSFPWRYFVIAKDDKQIIENTMTCKLASKCHIEDPSWIKPGQVSWEWWSGSCPYGPDVNFVSGLNLDTYKYFIDFAAKFGIPYILMDEGWAKSVADPYTPNPNVDLHELIRYGKEKNVKIVLWLPWVTVERNMDLFKKFKDWGIAGVKIDFMDRSDQWMVDFYERVAKEAAKNELFIDFHGAFKPAGIEYAYPNILSIEGVRGMEMMEGTTPDNSIYYPFMRNAVGPMDYTPGAMLSMQPEDYVSCRPNSASIGTRAYQMALYVVFESGLQMLADNPTLYYREKECTDFITQVPVTWDETKALYAKAGECVIVAKRKGDKWYMGGIINSQQQVKEIEVGLDFLGKGKSYEMTSFEDGINAGRQAMDYRKRVLKVDSTGKIKIKMVRNGGWAAVIQ